MFNKNNFKNIEPKPSYLDKKTIFEFKSYNLWALEEAFIFIDNHPELSTINALEAFIKKMDDYSCMAKTEKSSFMFSTAKAFGDYLLDNFLFEFDNVRGYY